MLVCTVHLFTLCSMKNAPITRTSTLFLKVVIILIGLGTLAFLLAEPHFEGRNVHATLFEIYFQDPFLAYVYIASIPFFVALYQAFTLLGYIGKNTVFSLESVRALRMIKYCATALVFLIAAAMAFIFIIQHGKDDIAGGIAMCLFATFISVIIATTAAVLEKLLQSAVEMKTEQDLTV